MMQTMAITRLLALLIIIEANQLLITQPVASVKVNLFLPWLSKVKDVSCRDLFCNLTVGTRAADYSFTNLNTAEISKQESLERVGEWVLYSLSIDDVVGKYIDEMQSSKNDFDTKTNLMLRRLDLSWLLCQTRVILSPEAYICIREYEMYFCNQDEMYCTPVEYKGRYRSRAVYLAPITTAFHFDYKQGVELKLGLFDIAGRLMTSRLKFSGRRLVSEEDWTIRSINALPYPLTDEKGNLKTQTRNSLNDLVDTLPPTVVQNMHDQLKSKMPLTYPSSITKCIVQPNSIEQDAWCYSKSVTKYSAKDNPIEIRQLSPKSKPPTTPLSNKLAGWQVQALHEFVKDGIVYRHLVRIPIDGTMAEYIFTVSQPRQSPSSDKSPGNEQSALIAISTIPNDIVGLSSGNCHKTISFFDSYYMVHNYNISLATPPENVQFERKINLIIMAAFADESHIFFFSHSGQLLRASYELTGDCNSFILKSEGIAQMNSHEFMKDFNYQNNAPGRREYIGQQELVEGANDTMPPTIGLWYPKNVESDDGSSFSLWVIIIILVVLAILVVAIVALAYYFCCFRRSPFTAKKASINRRGGFIVPYQTALSGFGQSSIKSPANQQPLARVKSSLKAKSKGIKSARGSGSAKKSGIARKSSGRAKSPIVRKSSRANR